MLDDLLTSFFHFLVYLLSTLGFGRFVVALVL